MSTAAPEISFSVFTRGGKGSGGRLLRTDFTAAEQAELAITPERAAAFEALRVACDETEAGEAGIAAATKELSARTRAFNDLKAELLNGVPKRTFMDEWRATVKGQR